MILLIIIITMMMMIMMMNTTMIVIIITKDSNNDSNNNDAINDIQRRNACFFYNLLTAPRPVSNTDTQATKAQSCAVHVQTHRALITSMPSVTW